MDLRDILGMLNLRAPSFQLSAGIYRLLGADEVLCSGRERRDWQRKPQEGFLLLDDTWLEEGLRSYKSWGNFRFEI